MFEFRVTRYDPRFRSVGGAYLRHDWASVSDIGKAFGGVVLTVEEYQRVEDAYVASAQAFLKESDIGSLRIRAIEGNIVSHPQFSEGAAIPTAEVGVILVRLLREELWCRLESSDAFIHVGYDYYMYIGVPSECLFAQRKALSLGLFVELFSSPYREEPAT